MMGEKSLTMDFIASDLGMSKRTIYELFRDKDELMMQAIEYLVMKNNQRLLETMKESAHVVEAIFVMIDDLRIRMRTSNPLILEDLKRYFVRLRAYYYANFEKCREFSVPYKLLEKGIREGIFRSDLQVEVVDIFIMELINLVHDSEALRMSKVTQELAFANILLPYFRGLCTPKGLQLIDSFTGKCNKQNE